MAVIGWGQMRIFEYFSSFMYMQSMTIQQFWFNFLLTNEIKCFWHNNKSDTVIDNMFNVSYKRLKETNERRERGEEKKRRERERERERERNVNLN